MKKFILLALLVMAMACPAFADNSRSTGDKVGDFVAVTDASSGVAAEVSSSSGALNVGKRAQAVTLVQGDNLVYTGACRVQSIIVTGVSAGDVAQIYDAVTATGTPKFDIKVGTANDTKIIDGGGAPFSTGIYADCTDGDVQVSVVYDY